MQKYKNNVNYNRNMKNIFAHIPLTAIRINVLAFAFLCSAPLCGLCQEKLTQDTLECVNIGFNFGTLFPSAAGSHAVMPDGTRSHDATMKSLYRGPWLDFGLDVMYKFKTNWVLDAEGSLLFGSDNLQNRTERMPGIFITDGIVIGNNGVDAGVTAYNRGLDLRLGCARIMKVIPGNPNSGILAKLSAGIMQQQTIFTANESNAPQLEGDYRCIYDHQRLGYTLTEGIGFWFMSNNQNLVNTKITFEVTQCWSHSTRDYTIDQLAGLNGKDDSRYFDLIYAVKLCWMFPLKGKTSYDYYYY